MSGRWVIATDNALIDSVAMVRRMDRVQLRDAENVRRVDRDYSLNIFGPGYIAVAAIPGGLHFVPVPQPWGLITWVAMSYFFGLAIFHIALGLSGAALEKLPRALNPDTLTACLAVVAVLASLAVFSFLAPSPINRLYGQG